MTNVAKVPLSTYRAKRDPAKTPEPMGEPRASLRRSRTARPAPEFVIQEHHATALHWDFRLEHDGVLVSWALPKGLPTEPSKNHLAVPTEDHPIEYGSFEGDIPKGQYGGGRVDIWDRGTYELEKWTEREVKVVLHGSRSTGRYVLFPTRGTSWMIHRMDPAPAGFTAMPDRIAPMLAEAGSIPTDETGWAYELKWDGVRAVAFVEGGRVRARSRNDKDLTASFPELRAVGEHLGSRSAILDGEIVAFGEDGRPSFGRLQRRLHLGSHAEAVRRAGEVAASYLVFDLLYLEGRSLLACPYDERRELLEGLELSGSSFATPEVFRDRSGSDVLSAARENGLEGVVAKRRASPYHLGSRGGDWVKVKIFRTQEVVVGGWTVGKGAQSGSLGSLLLGVPGTAGLDYVGKVGTGFDKESRQQILDLLAPRVAEASPFASLGSAESALARFVRPELVGEVRYGEWTSAGRLRHPSWRGLRPDKNPSEVVRER